MALFPPWSIPGMSPSEYVTRIATFGLPGFYPGPIKIKAYLCALGKFGGNKGAQNLLLQLNSINGIGPFMMGKPAIYTTKFGYLEKGAAYVSDYQLLWSWMWENRAAVRQLKVTTSKGVIDLGAHYGTDDIAFASRTSDLSFQYNLFGMDCIGFVGQYLVNIGHLNEYPSLAPREYISRGRFRPIKDLTEIAAQQIIVYDDHIQIIDRVKFIGSVHKNVPNVARVDICQSTKGGPQTFPDVEIKQDANGMLTIDGTPPNPNSLITVAADPSLKAAYPGASPPPRLGFY